MSQSIKNIRIKKAKDKFICKKNFIFYQAAVMYLKCIETAIRIAKEQKWTKKS